ncbi:MAG: hypothetical protein CMN32_14545 [Saprospirales bacterium]|nr:hypothetical protein [Saprospirales bacterium]
MIALLFDENIHNGIIRAISLRNPEIDILRVQDTLLKGKPDEAVLEYALQNRRVLITHDLNSIPPLLTHMHSQGKEHHGVVFVPTSLPIGQVIDDLILFAITGEPEDLKNQALYLPL